MAKEKIYTEEKEIFSNQMIAKKDFIISKNDVYIEIKKGDKINVPKEFLINLEIEGVI